MKVLVTGAGGYLGRGLVVPFEEHGYDLRLMDVVPFESPHETVVGDVADLETVRKALDGCEAIVIAHMASRQAGSYDTPEAPFNANVKGTANLFFAAVEQGVQRVALISSTGVQYGYDRSDFLDRHKPMKGTGLYCLTKVCQEVIAEQYHREHGIKGAALRIGCVVDGDTACDKYGRKFETRGLALTDRRDIGEVARLSLECPDIEWEIFYVISTPEAPKLYDVDYTCRRLGWKPKYDFTWLPLDEPAEPAG
ncbi:MAG: NAD-dependent epimerase/dehydratase family protein [Anaerolineaceae bacterium]|nr:NAD-dependent epimerase/dehydratase family protein [Anaerolineaceae bacterium]